ncbi:hypothetical protein Poly51_23200 [Rubripirellula tenax]|uniref:GYF domain-containing protein n=1 Tax=Rubripirellula tenax TaxID=2528015 RepID=A0A5C6F741_9BACT|nr:GYF domain-containing protein [Rubripirellula tenax]TWU56410.1 hypothetical protein Poly51_23200 [Rubripirellula tenax]
MGVRFACHACNKQLNIKQEFAGRRGVCPKCKTKFRIPVADSDVSSPIQDTPAEPATRSRPAPKVSAASQPSAKRQPSAGAAISLIADEPDATWYVRPPSGGQYGPASGDLLKQWIEEGRVAATALIWREGWPQWRPADEALVEVASILPSVSEVAKPAVQPAASPRPQVAPESDVTTPTFAGQANIGAARRSRSFQRIFWIGALTLIAISLAVALYFLLNRPAA